MHQLLQIIAYLIVFCGIINLLRMSIFLVGSDLYSLFHHIHYRKLKKGKEPLISIVIPSHNEAASIRKCISSVLKNNYPKDKIEIIVVNDGSTDITEEKLQEYSEAQYVKIKIINQERSGKANALNNGMRNHASGELVMCLDADSYLGKDSLKNVAKYFTDKNVGALASNVKIDNSKGLLNKIQRMEYALCYQMKRAQTVFNIEYIIGGIGSVFRKSLLEKVGYYDGDTVTEDIDITMKILRAGNKNVKVMYGSDVIAYTQSVLSISDLIKQRYRWKWGRCQTFLKNKHMFFTKDHNFSKGLTWIFLPYAIFSDIAFFLEPLFVSYIFYLVIRFHDFFTLISAFSIITFFMIMNIVAEDSLSIKEKLTFILLSPLMYFLFYLLSFVEYIALLKSLFNLHNLRASLEKDISHWKPVQRLGFN